MVSMAIDTQRLLQPEPFECCCTYCCNLVHPDDALQAPCGHFWCSGCIKTAITDGPTTCPIHRTAGVSAGNLRPLKEQSNLYYRMLLSVRVKCAKYEDGCPWQGELSEARAHEARCTAPHCQCCNQSRERVTVLEEANEALLAAQEDSEGQVTRLRASVGAYQARIALLEQRRHAQDQVAAARAAELEGRAAKLEQRCADEAETRRTEVAALAAELRASRLGAESAQLAVRSQAAEAARLAAFATERLQEEHAQLMALQVAETEELRAQVAVQEELQAQVAAREEARGTHHAALLGECDSKLKAACSQKAGLERQVAELQGSLGEAQGELADLRARAMEYEVAEEKRKMESGLKLEQLERENRELQLRWQSATRMMGAMEGLLHDMKALNGSGAGVPSSSGEELPTAPANSSQPDAALLPPPTPSLPGQPPPTKTSNPPPRVAAAG
eukprot:jgi/Mesen1/467/ME000101S10696